MGREERREKAIKRGRDLVVGLTSSTERRVKDGPKSDVEISQKGSVTDVTL